MSEANPLDRFVSCCLTCKYWGGDKVKQIENIEKSGEVCMSIKDGWPEFGGCWIADEWAYLNINGDAVGKLEIDANFGCNRHEADS